MFSRWYALFLGFLLLILGVAGLVVAAMLPTGQAGLVTTSVIWLLIAAVGLWLGFGVRNNDALRWFAGIVGGLFILWGIIQMIAAPAIATMGIAAAVASVSGFLILLGCLGLAAALVPATWLREPTPMAT